MNKYDAKTMIEDQRWAIIKELWKKWLFEFLNPYNETIWTVGGCLLLFFLLVPFPILAVALLNLWIGW